MNSERSNQACLLVTCPDRPGIVASVAHFLFAQGANITSLDQHTSDPNGGTFFLRLEFQADATGAMRENFAPSFESEVAVRFQMKWSIQYRDERIRVAILVSKQGHALLDLLWAHRRGELRAEISVVISNYPELRDAVEWFGIPFEHLPAERGEEGMAATEAQMMSRLKDQIDLIVLARYMRVLSGRFVAHFRGRMINIHHSFLPAFVGADPYRQAHQYGVKLIGATAHFVVEQLDAGPIIEQDVMRVTHRQSVEDLRSLGRDLEQRVLRRAVQGYLERRVIIDGNKTVVFSPA